MLSTDKEFLTPDEIAAWRPQVPPAPHTLSDHLRKAVDHHGLDTPAQVAGFHFPIGCVALEITQRCNLDCSACYLSDLSEAVLDLPLVEILRRVDQIAAYYGPYTNVQISGGDPTLRKTEDLVAIVRRIASHKMRSALFTNGIKATRSLLATLSDAGLNDVAFHVDMTQGRRGYGTEADLNAIRDDYINQAKGLGLQILFNTTVFDGNVDEVPMLARFFRDRAAYVHLASFQMIADTGRGVIRDRAHTITQHAIIRRISDGAGVELAFEYPQVGHSECNRYAMVLTAGDETAAAFDSKHQNFIEDMLVAGRTAFFDRHRPWRSLQSLASMLFRNPGLLLGASAYVASRVWALRRGLVKSKGRANRLTFYIHNFMHADQLQKDRCESCVFMTMTRDGPVSMCVHNAKRDAFILQKVKDDAGQSWSPLGHKSVGRDRLDPKALPLKRLKGRHRATKLEQT